jgi:hypothetical protein
MAAVIVTSCVALLAACSGSGSGPATAHQIAPLPTITARPAPKQTYQAGPRQPAIPVRGAYVGASVQPQSFSEEGREQAIRELQSQLGRPLDLVHVYQTWDASFPATTDRFALNQGSYLMLSWAMTDTRVIASGRDDSVIRAEAAAIRATRAPILLEPRWEMDRPNLSGVIHSAADFVAAWHHIYKIFRETGVHNAAWVWCPTATGFANGRAPAYYPGDAQVDWLCTDAYPGPQELPLSTLIGPFLVWAARHDKPAMVGEFGISRAVPPSQRAAWLQEAADTFRANPQLLAMVYWDSGFDSAETFNFSLGGDGPAMASFRSVVRRRYFDPRQVIGRS